MSENVNRELTPLESALIPRTFETPRFWTQDTTSFYSAYWTDEHGQNLFVHRTTLDSDITGWRVARDDSLTSDLTREEYLAPYQGHQFIHDLNLFNLTGLFQGRDVRWSTSRGYWAYNNGRCVNFPSHTEEAEVSGILSSVEETLTRISEQVLTPRSSTPNPAIPSTPPSARPSSSHVHEEPSQPPDILLLIPLRSEQRLQYPTNRVPANKERQHSQVIRPLENPLVPRYLPDTRYIIETPHIQVP